MKTILIIMSFLLVSISAFNQDRETAMLIASIQGQYQLDENGNVTYQKIVDSINLTKTELYNRAMDYFVFNYGDANSVIQNRDIENGIIIGKGIFKSVFYAGLLNFTTIDTWHILKIEAKDNRARITLALTNYDETITGGTTPDIHNSFSVSAQYPFVFKGYLKTRYGKAFYESHRHALETIASLERALRGDSTKNKNDNW